MGLVQFKQGTSAATTLTITLTSPTVAGHGLIVKAATSWATSNGTISGITLGGSADHFASAATAGSSTNAANVACWLDLNCAGGQTSVVITTSGGSGAAVLLASVEERDDLPSTLAFDKSAGSTSNGSTSWTSTATATTTQANELWTGLSLCLASGSTPSITGPSSPWSNLAQISQAGSGFTNTFMAGSQVVAATGAATYNGTVSPSSEWVGLVATLKLTSAAASILPQQAKHRAPAIFTRISNPARAGVYSR